jgi:hypothetical protein
MNRPFVMIWKFISTPFVGVPAADTVTLAALQKEQIINGLYDGIILYLFFMPLFIFMGCMLIYAVSNRFSCRYQKGIEVGVRIPLVYALMGISFGAVYFINTRCDNSLDKVLDSPVIEEIIANPNVNLLYMVELIKIYAALELVFGIIMLVCYVSLDKRRFNMV